MKILQNSELGHQKCREATTSDIATARQVVEFLNENNGTFAGQYSHAFALSHCQITTDNPARFFVVAKDFVEKPDKKEKDDNRNDTNYYFEDQVVFNPEVIEALPTFLVDAEKDGKTKKVAMSNIFRPVDACMSFPHRKPKKTDRFLKITVKYQVEIDGKLVDREESIEGLKAHIFQHEVDHHNGIDIHYGDGVTKDIPISMRYVGTSDTVLPEPEEENDEDNTNNNK
jgi:peptide deformylase